MRIEIRTREVGSAAELCAGYRAAHDRLWGPRQKPEAPPVVVVASEPIIVPLPKPKPSAPAWLADLIAFNELIRGLFSVGKERRLKRVERMVETVAAHYDLTTGELIGGPRSHAHARRRQIAMYICLSHLGMSTVGVGLFFRRDHTTVVHARKAVLARMAADPVLAIEVHKLVASCI